MLGQEQGPSVYRNSFLEISMYPPESLQLAWVHTGRVTPTSWGTLNLPCQSVHWTVLKLTWAPVKFKNPMTLWSYNPCPANFRSNNFWGASKLIHKEICLSKPLVHITIAHDGREADGFGWVSIRPCPLHNLDTASSPLGSAAKATVNHAGFTLVLQLKTPPQVLKIR